MYYVANNVTQGRASGAGPNFASAEFLCGLLNQVSPGVYGVYCNGVRVYRPTA